MVSIIDIKKYFHGRIALSEPMSKHSSIRIGGPADYYLEPKDKDDLINILDYLHQQQYPFIIIGRGTNLLVSDDGIRGAVINLENALNKILTKDDLIAVEAGVSMARFVDICINNGFSGIERLAGIPGSVGGAIVMNAGAYGEEISDHLIEVEVLRKDNIIKIKKEDAGFSYRHSIFHDDIILSADFKFPIGDKTTLDAIRQELLAKRNQTQPLNYPNFGSTFKNPPGTSAAKLIEESGLKGTQRGKAQISEKHANFIVNLGGATAKDVLELIRIARDAVHDEFGINLELEVKLCGFTEDIYKKVVS